MSQTTSSVATPGGPVAEVAHLSVRYGRTIALDSASFQVQRGAVYALLGRNGAGKSSLVRCLLGQQQPSSGRATLFGQDVWTQRAQAMARVGVVPEEPDAPAAMTAIDLSRFLSTLYPRWDHDGFVARLARFEVAATTPFGRLSKGQKGQIMLGLALAHTPELLVLDDPTLGLDVVARNAVFEEVVAELADRGTSVLITSHDLGGVERIADRVGILREGRLAVDEDLEKLKARVRLVRYRRGPGATGAEAQVFVVLQRDAGPLGESLVVSNFEDARFQRFVASEGVLDAKPSSLSLEEIFTAVTAVNAETVVNAVTANTAVNGGKGGPQ